MNPIHLILATLILFSCKKQPNQQKLSKNTSAKTIPSTPIIEEEILYYITEIDSIKLGINFTPKGSYNILLNQITNKKIFFKNQYITAPQKTLDAVSDYFLNILLNHIVPHWYNTPWAFEGHSNIPNQGEIACGYFVSTTLKHFGFNLNRYKMAQQAGLNTALSVQPKNELKIYRNIDYSKLKENLLSIYSDGLYFVGLSNHVGYVLIKNKELYFLHSSYCDNKVVIEYAEHSYCFESDIYVFAEISTNKNLLKKWIFNEYIPIIQ